MSASTSTLAQLFSAIRAKHPEALEDTEFPDTGTTFSLWQLLKSKLRMDQWQLASVVGELSGLPVCRNLKACDATLIQKFPQRLATQLMTVPVRKESDAVILAIANPFDSSIAQFARFSFGDAIRLEVAPPSEIEVAIAQGYGDAPRSKSRTLTLDDGSQANLDEKEIPRLARKLLIRALKSNASDIHIQPFVGGFAVRLRIDGLMQRLVILPDAVGESLIRYFKASGGMDPTNDRIPQDGRMSLEWEHHDYDLRISVLPVTGGEEKMVVRLLNKAAIYNLHNTGMSLAEIQTLRRMTNAPSGVVLICGPTGSGKTTTLYSILAEKNDESVSIATIENPVEYKFPGLSQTEVNEKAGLSFAAALRSLLRQDPDILLIGEIRDSETAQIAMQSALTGHLVFSTLHTNDALAAIPRLLDLGVPGQILAQALSGVVSQRLFRKLCVHCREPVQNHLRADEEAFKNITHVTPPYRASGCSHCHYSGYIGRLVVTEMLEMTPELIASIEKGEMRREKLLAAADKGMRTMSGATARRIISGDTTCAEATRVIGRHFWLEVASEYGSKFPDLGQLDSSESDSHNLTGILLAGEEGSFSKAFEQQLGNAWYKAFYATSPAAARQLLEEHDSIRFVMLDLPERLSDEQVKNLVAEYRREMAWSRLPAVLLYPDARPELEELLRADGATSRFVGKSAAPGELIEIVNSALARHVDFRWEGFAMETSDE